MATDSSEKRTGLSIPQKKRAAFVNSQKPLLIFESVEMMITLRRSEKELYAEQKD